MIDLQAAPLKSEAESDKKDDPERPCVFFLYCLGFFRCLFVYLLLRHLQSLARTIPTTAPQPCKQHRQGTGGDGGVRAGGGGLARHHPSGASSLRIQARRDALMCPRETSLAVGGGGPERVAAEGAP